MKARGMIVLVFVLGTILAAAQPASAAATVVRGRQTPVDSGPCFDGDAVFSTTMDGGLIGCWWIDTYGEADHPSGTILASGTEHFTGCLDLGLDGACDHSDPSGTFFTTFTFTAKFAADGSEIHGRCHHPIVSGTGAFEGVSGMLQFTDEVATGLSPYTGLVRL